MDCDSDDQPLPKTVGKSRRTGNCDATLKKSRQSGFSRANQRGKGSRFSGKRRDSREDSPDTPLEKNRHMHEDHDADISLAKTLPTGLEQDRDGDALGKSEDSSSILDVSPSEDSSDEDKPIAKKQRTVADTPSKKTGANRGRPGAEGGHVKRRSLGAERAAASNTKEGGNQGASTSSGGDAPNASPNVKSAIPPPELPKFRVLQNPGTTRLECKVKIVQTEGRKELDLRGKTSGPKPPSSDDVKIVTFYNHKGGVGKSTCAYSTAWELAGDGQRVLLVDADPQRNLTQMALNWAINNQEYAAETDDRNMRSFSQQQGNTDTIYTMLCNARDELDITNGERLPSLWKFHALDLFLLAGDHRIQDMDQFITAAHFSADQTAGGFANIARARFGLFYHRLQDVAKFHKINTIIIDLSPSSGVFNRVVLLSSTYFITPANPDYFCQEAMESLTTYIPAWFGQVSGTTARATEYCRFYEWSNDSPFPLPANADDCSVPRLPKFLGTILTRLGHSPLDCLPSFNVEHFFIKVQDKTDSMIKSLEAHPHLRMISMNVAVPDYYKRILKDALPNIDDQKPDPLLKELRQGTITIVRDFNQMGYLAQRLSKPVALLNTDSADFMKFDKRRYQREVRLVEARVQMVLPPLKEFLICYDKNKDDIHALRNSIRRAHASFSRIAMLIQTDGRP